MIRFVLIVGVSAVALADGPADLFPAIRAGDIAYVKAHLAPAAVNARDRRGATPLMHAAAFGNLETVKRLIDAGADVNARNEFSATALLWCARDPEKARLLISHGADVNAASKQGRTPLMLASLLHGGAATVALMLSKGADVNAKDSRGDTALSLAASIGEAESMRLLLAKGADPEAVNAKGERPIIHATRSSNPEAVRLLLDRRVDVNVANTSYNTVRNGPIALIKMAPLHRAAAHGPLEMVTSLLKAGADVNVRDSRGLTPLVFAVATDFPSAPILRALLAAGADVNLRDNTGQTALDWAAKFGYPEPIALLTKAGAERRPVPAPPKAEAAERPQPRAAVARSVDLLQKSSAEFFTRGGCVGCHHQPMAARAQRVARDAGLAIDGAAARDQLAQMKGQWLASQEEFLQSLNPGGGANRLAENLLGLDSAGYPADLITDSAVVDLVEAQSADGAWSDVEEHPRPPITESGISGTARAIRAVQAYTIPARQAEFAGRIARARSWLQRAEPRTTEEFAMRLLGLTWAGAPAADLRAAAKPLIDLQRRDGGWSPNPYLPSDAFSTGQALTALAESNAVSPADALYRRGVEHLLSTQFPDGSWYVASRALKFQPYFESGFPFGHDQWISAAATAWAVQAITPALRPPRVTRESQR